MNEPSFLQSADWARFQAAVGHPALEHDDVRFFKNSLPLGGSYLYAPHPDIRSGEEFVDRAVDLARREGSWFVRVEPNVGSVEIRSTKNGVGIRPTLPIQPGRTWHVALGSDEQMLAAMHDKHRYNIRVAEKHNVIVRFSRDQADATTLYDLLAKTGERAGIRLHDARYYKTMLETLGSASALRVEIAFAESEGTAVAAALIAHFGDRAIYLHGGSDYEHRALMAPQLLHWKVMQRAAAVGQSIYDMGGIAPDDQPNHSWTGITRFKMGFGGQAVDYPPAVDVIVNPFMYQIYLLGRRFNRSMR